MKIEERKIYLDKLAQFGLVLGILFFAEFLQKIFSLPIPSTIISIIILLTLMMSKIVKLEWVEGIGNTLLDNIPILFVPAGVGIMKEYDLLKGHIISLTIIILVSTTIVIVVTGYTVQILENSKGGKNI